MSINMHSQIIKINKNYKKERNKDTEKKLSRQKCTYMKQIKQEKDKKKIKKKLENNVHTCPF